MARKIVIDPGHGGHDSGAIGFGLQEKNLTLDLALRLRSLLANYADVSLTRNSDVFISLSDRAAYANKIGADLFVSIHVNAGGGTGFESYVYTGALEQTRTIRQKIHQEIAAFYKSVGYPDRGMKSAGFTVLKQTLMPAVLLENLFIDNQKDAASLKDAQFRDKIASATANGLITALSLSPGSQPQPQPTPAPEPPPQPSAPQPWAVENFERLQREGLVFGPHDLNSVVTWGEMSAVLARLLDKINTD